MLQSLKLWHAGHVETWKELEIAWEPQSNFLLQLIFLPTQAHRGALLCTFCLYRKTRFAKKGKKKKEQKDSIAFHPLRFHYPGRANRYQRRKADSNAPTSGFQLLAINCSLGLFDFCGGHVLPSPLPELLTVPPFLSCEGAKPWGVEGLLGNHPSGKPRPGYKLADFWSSAFCSTILQREVRHSILVLKIIREPPSLHAHVS